MIFDTLKGCKSYYGVNAKFEKAFDFIRQAEKEGLPVGKYEIDGKELYASVQEYVTKQSPDGKFEGHANYIDIQYVISGVELMEVVDIAKATAKTEYNDVKDVTFYEDYADATKGVVEAGGFGIFFPNDIHKPGMTYGNQPSAVKKIVVKVKI